MKMELTRLLTEHHDGFGLNDSISIKTDDPDPNAGNGAHRYVADIGGHIVADVQFQHGPRLMPDSIAGMTDDALLLVCMDRLRLFQAGPFACRENALALTHLETGWLWMRKRTTDRAHRGVLGKNIK